MLRKILFSVLAMFTAASLLVSCEWSADDPLSAAESSATPSHVSEASSAGESRAEDSTEDNASSEIILIESSDEEESSMPTIEESEISEEISYPDPTCAYTNITTPENPEEEPITIRSIHQVEEDVLELYGDIDLQDEETAAAIAQIEELLANYSKEISFFAYSLDGTRAISYNCEDNYFSACTIKAGYMLYCCLAIDQGLASKDDVMYYQEKYYHGGSGRIKNSEYGTPYTLEELIKLSLSVSDNIAYKMLVAYFGTEGYNAMVEQLGVERLKLSSSSVWNYRTTARDLSIVWRELYFYFRTESEMAQLYKSSCTNTRFNYATIYLDEDYSHKSGDKFKPDPVYNDAAIVWKEMPYVIATLNGSEGEAEDEYVVATIVKLINDHIMK